MAFLLFFFCFFFVCVCFWGPSRQNPFSAAQKIHTIQIREFNFVITDHIVHHVCTIFALGAAPDAIRRHYDRNASYQRPPPPLEDHIVQGLYDPAKFLANLTEPSRYRDYLMFFQKEIAKKGYEDVLNEYVFKSDERANIMFARLYAGGFFSF